MKSEPISVQQLFQDRRQYCVPFYQRAYVWTKIKQWTQLWEDIEVKADARLAGSKATPHFLGAVVLDPQQREGLLGVDVFHIIDGQQRITTLQYLLVGLLHALRAHDINAFIPSVTNLIQNPNPETMTNQAIEVFKVWPTFKDRQQFRSAFTAPSLDALRERFPAHFTNSGSFRKIDIEHPPALEAIWYFAEVFINWIKEEPDQKPRRAEALISAILRDFRIVSIALDADDDAQIIFETLNGRGAQLLATDLIRNFLFMQADREKANAEALYDSLWSPFEADYWSVEQRRGRQNKPRIEWLIHAALQAELRDDVDLGRLYFEYRRFALNGTPHLDAEHQLLKLTDYGQIYKELIGGQGLSPAARFGTRIRAYDITTLHPLAMVIASSALDGTAKTAMFDDLVSYVVRRTVCGLTAKNYNNVFMTTLRQLSSAGVQPGTLRNILGALKSDASRWPTDAEFRNALTKAPLYPGNLDPAKTRSLLTEIESHLRGIARPEEVALPEMDHLDIDHILPKSWYTYWTLPDDSTATAADAGEAEFAMWSETPLTDRQKMLCDRAAAIPSLGNLTLLNLSVNREAQNFEFERKRDLLIANTTLRLNVPMIAMPAWDEARIAARAQTLADAALAVWPGPGTP